MLQYKHERKLRDPLLYMYFVYCTESPLRITRPLTDTECLEGETVSFVCEVSKPGVPALWLKDGVAISEEDGFEFIADGCIHILKIPEATVDHDAVYTIKINGSKSIAKLFVEGRLLYCICG